MRSGRLLCPSELPLANELLAIDRGKCNAGRDGPDRRLVEERVMMDHHELLPKIVVILRIRVKIIIGRK
jgi:hypothetical protein